MDAVDNTDAATEISSLKSGPSEEVENIKSREPIVSSDGAGFKSRDSGIVPKLKLDTYGVFLGGVILVSALSMALDCWRRNDSARRSNGLGAAVAGSVILALVAEGRLDKLVFSYEGLDDAAALAEVVRLDGEFKLMHDKGPPCVSLLPSPSDRRPRPCRGGVLCD